MTIFSTSYRPNIFYGRCHFQDVRGSSFGVALEQPRCSLLLSTATTNARTRSKIISCSHWMVLEIPIKKELCQEFHRNGKNKRDYLTSCYLEKPVSKTTKSTKTRKWNQKVTRIDANFFFKVNCSTGFREYISDSGIPLKKGLIMLNAILTINKHLCNFNCCISLEYTENLCSFCVVRNQHI